MTLLVRWTLIACLVWTFGNWLVQANLDGYGDMLENYAWSQVFAWGSFKHPPLFAWTTGWWFSVAPQTDFSYKLFAYLNVAVSLWGVYALARQLHLSPRLAVAAALLLLWSFPYTSLAAKFNANSQLLPLWPWTAAVFLMTWRARGWRGAALAIALGLLGAACMLAKYVSGVFLLGLFLTALASREGRAWFRSLPPFIALVTFCLALAPHVAWLIPRGFPTLVYAEEQGAGAVSWGYLAEFALSPLIYWMPAWLACSGLFAWAKSRRDGLAFFPAWGRAAVRAWLPQGKDDTLFWITMLPGGIMLLFGACALVQLSIPWAIPIGYGFSILWLRNLSIPSGADATAPWVAGRIVRATGPVLVVVIAVCAISALVSALTSNPGYYRPTQQAAVAIAQGWQARHPDVNLGWVGGQWPANGMIAFYADPAARTLPGLPDAYPTLYVPQPGWAREGGLLLCPMGQAEGARDRAEGDPCVSEAAGWLTSKGLDARPHVVTVARSGWQFPRPVPYSYWVYDYVPVGGSGQAKENP